ncbi:DUF928 domain-containing protein [Aerosakkonema funiforme]|uniref:DUF928 domain-containing protein n=1 Tax=Aerosakkonema funiforme FACHB-1375 TaxID=2949571 RepID=A0A926VCV2_9CYAN|nr:DUF928 domain-containing protein [Aerosakkonema funiforme]MBD2181468.1 DUF928 domain-containing protein [Aerosakkonema funiforme FACHB-1375]
MSRQISISSKAIFTVALSLDLCAIVLLPHQVLSLTNKVERDFISSENFPASNFEIAQYVPPKNLGVPPETASGATRSGSCSRDEQSTSILLTALIPSLNKDDNWALTTAENPQMFVYVPQTSARMAEFALQDEDGKDVYRTTFTISGAAGIVSFSVPKNAVKLEKNQNYHWYFSIFCSDKNRRQSSTVDGWIRRVELNSLRPNLANELEGVGEKERSQLYAQNGVWYDALATLAELRRDDPNDTALAQEWKKLLESAGLKELGDFPIIPLN